MEKTILDFKKFDNVYGGVRDIQHNTYLMREMEISAVKVRFDRLMSSPMKVNIKRIQLCIGRKFSQMVHVLDANDLYLTRLYESADDFICDKNPINLMWNCEDEILDYIYEKLGLECYLNEIDKKPTPYLWKWDEESREAKLMRYFELEFDLVDLKLPEGVYASEEECIKDNKKVVNVKVTKVYDMEIDESDLEDALNNPSLVETQDEDVSYATAEIADKE